MRMVRSLLPALVLTGLATPVMPLDFNVDGYVDLRLIVPSDQVSWQDGKLGKLRYGAENGKPEARVAETVGQAVVLFAPELMGLAVVRVESEQRTFFDLLEGYIRYRPVSTTPWRWSVKGGAFFAPVSLENTEIGWTSPWTLTPSAINSWVGEELRTIGVEGMLEWRSEMRKLTFSASIYGWNDPAGALVADRGWALHDRVTGLIDKPREPDQIAYAIGVSPPLFVREAMEIDDRPGWYAAGSWEETGLGKVNVIYYHNEADPAAIRSNTIAWRTDFWNVGAQTEIGNVTLLAQGLMGETLIVPNAFFFSDTYFRSAYLLAGWTIAEDWRIAGRFDVFSNKEERPFPGDLSEHGNAFTFAVNYLPTDWLRITAEAIRVNSTRNQRLAENLDPHAVEDQVQISARLYLP